MTNRKTGLIGGTFNPVHYGHLFLAEQAMEYCHLDQVLFIPSGISYMKNVREIASAEDRLQMVRLATENHPDFHVSSVETDRPGESYTCETLLTLSREYADTRFYFIIGADNLFSIEKWKEPAEIFRRCTLVAAFRGDEARSALEEKAEDLYHKYQAEIILLPKRRIDISSTEIRQRITEKRSIRYMVPEPVRNYITAHGVYQKA